MRIVIYHAIMFSHLGCNLSVSVTYFLHPNDIVKMTQWKISCFIQFLFLEDKVIITNIMNADIQRKSSLQQLFMLARIISNWFGI